MINICILYYKAALMGRAGIAIFFLLIALTKYGHTMPSSSIHVDCNTIPG